MILQHRKLVFGKVSRCTKPFPQTYRSKLIRGINSYGVKYLLFLSFYQISAPLKKKINRFHLIETKIIRLQKAVKAPHQYPNRDLKCGQPPLVLRGSLLKQKCLLFLSTATFFFRQNVNSNAQGKLAIIISKQE